MRFQRTVLRQSFLLTICICNLLLVVVIGCKKEDEPATGPDTTPPSVAISTPVNNSTVTDSIVVVASVSDNVGVQKVEFYIDGNLTLARAVPPWQCSWNVLALVDASLHTILAKAYDAAGNVGTSSTTIVTVQKSDKTAPTVAILTPLPNALVVDSVLITANATDNVAVTRVEFYIDGTMVASRTSVPWSYRWVVTNLPLSSHHSIVAKAYDAAINIGTSQTIDAIVTIPPPSLGLVSYFPFTGNVNDLSGYGNNLTANGGAFAADRFGVSNRAYSLNGVNNWLKGSATNLPQAARTISLWFYSNDFTTRPMFFAYGGSNICGTSFQMGINCDGALETHRYHIQSHCEVNILGYYYAQEPTGQWHNWLVTSDVSGTSMYVDGVKVASNTTFINNTITNGKDLAIGITVSPSGVAPYVDANIGYFKGSLDDIRIYNRALSDAEIQLVYHEGGW